MKQVLLKILPLFLALLVLSGCKQNVKMSESDGSDVEVSKQLQGSPTLPVDLLKEEWPVDLVPMELIEYTEGTVVSFGGDEDTLYIKIRDTDQDKLDKYLKTLKSAGWIITGDNSEATAAYGLHTIEFHWQDGGKLLQMMVYSMEEGSWPSAVIPPDILEPQKGILIGEVELIEAGENMWYFNYTYDEIDEEAAREYMELLIENGWRGDSSQLYKNFNWNGKQYEASIEIYETVDYRTTFTCNFYETILPEPSLEGSTPHQETADNLVIGSWMLGTLSGVEFNSDSGKYEGGASGMGQLYTFKQDGSYTALVIWADVLYFKGNYSASAGVLTLTNRTVEESKDGGKSWSEPETLPDSTAPFVYGTDDMGAYLLLGEEGATLPLVEKTNAMKYRLQE